jgi:mersacidin/lichenicidin family type 2 lantibiotic
MSAINIIRAWKDEEYRLSLSEAERASLPDHPAGAIELPDALLDGVAGGAEYTNFSACAGCGPDRY